MRLFIILAIAVVMSGCAGIQTRNSNNPEVAVPSPSTIPASHQGSHYMVLGVKGDRFLAEYKNISKDNDGLTNNGKFFVLPVKVWAGGKWSQWKKAIFFHWTEGDKLTAAQSAAIKAVDYVVACYATTLPPFARAKAWVKSEGKTVTWLVWDHVAGISLLAGKDGGLSKEEREAKKPLGNIVLQ